MPAARDSAAARSPLPPTPPAEVFWAEPPARDVVLVRGGDAVRFLDGFQTAAVATLAENHGTETFFTDGRGHVLVLANLYRPACVDTSSSPAQAEQAVSACTPSGVAAVAWLDVPAGTAARLVEHLEHYHIREDVEFMHVAADVASAVFVGGPGTAAWLTGSAPSGSASSGSTPSGSTPSGSTPSGSTPSGSESPRFVGSLPLEPLALGAGSLGGVPVRIVRSHRFAGSDTRGSDTRGSGFEVFAAAADLPRLVAWLSASGLPRVEPAMLEELRILARYPEPHDIPPKTLPQELDRPAAISFTKGCYLGQETVARLDALGHVNRRLVVVAVDGAPPEPPAAVLGADETPVGTITSACPSTRLGCSIGLALVHVKALAPGATTSVAGRPARILGSAPEIRP